MKIEGPGKSQQADKSKKKDKTKTGDSSFGDMVRGTGGQAPASGAQSLAKVDSLLAVQAAEDPTERAARRRNAERADAILDELEKVRTGLLTGTITVGHVIDVADIVASHREKIMDPRLTAILDEIDLRAQIELAKMKKGM